MRTIRCSVPGASSAKRKIAARQIITSLVEMGAVSVVSTHDLDLAGTPEMLRKAVSAHFSDTVRSYEGAGTGTRPYGHLPAGALAVS